MGAAWCLSVICAGSVLAVEPGAIDEIIQPIPEIQAKIAGVHAQIGTKNPGRTEEAVWLNIMAAISRLKSEAESEPRKLVEQLIYYNAGQLSDIYASFVPGVVTRHLGVDKRAIAEAAVTYVYVSHPGVRAVADEFLTGIEQRGLAPLEFTYYRSIVIIQRKDGKEVPVNVIRRMYERDPAEAFDSLVMVYSSEPAHRELVLAKHVVDEMLWRKLHRYLKPGEVPPEVLPQLDKLAKDGGWWGRLYVAEITRRNPELRDPSIMERLRKDSTQIVRLGMMDPKDRPEKIEPPPQPGPVTQTVPKKS